MAIASCRTCGSSGRGASRASTTGCGTAATAGRGSGSAWRRSAHRTHGGGSSLAESAIRTRHDVTVVGLKRPGEDFIYAVPETVVLEGDQLIVSGTKRDVERFARIS